MFLAKPLYSQFLFKIAQNVRKEFSADAQHLTKSQGSDRTPRRKETDKNITKFTNMTVSS